MIKHIVMYRLKERTDANALALRDKFLSMRGKIPQLKQIDAGVDLTKSERSYDVALECVFDSVEDLNAYVVCDVHLPVAAYVKSVVAESHSVDFEF